MIEDDGVVHKWFIDSVATTKLLSTATVYYCSSILDAGNSGPEDLIQV